MTQPQISFVAPLYNEQESFATLIARLNKVMDEGDHRDGAGGAGGV